MLAHSTACQRQSKLTSRAELIDSCPGADSAGSIPVTRSEAVKGLRACGYSWAEIGSRLGTTRQAAQQRGHSENDPPARISRNPGH